MRYLAVLFLFLSCFQEVGHTFIIENNSTNTFITDIAIYKGDNTVNEKEESVPFFTWSILEPGEQTNAYYWKYGTSVPLGVLPSTTTVTLELDFGNQLVEQEFTASTTDMTGITQITIQDGAGITLTQN